jgi:hypothetical protein
MSQVAFAVLVSVPLVLVTPHLLPLHRAAPQTAAAVWLLALLLRAGLAIAIAIFAAIQLADVPPVHALFDWCWHEVLPDVPGWFGFGEHPVADAVVTVPLLAVTLSVLWLGLGYARAWRELRRSLGRSLGPGPLGSTVVDEEAILIAVTRVGARRIIVSKGALGELDDGELRAGLTHELGHIRRRHRGLMIAGSLLAALAVPLPGTRAAQRGLRFQLERDADAYAVRRLRDPLALATAISKAAVDSAPPGLASLGGKGGVGLRLRELVEGGQVRSATAERGAKLLAVGLAALTICLGATSPGWAVQENGGQASVGAHACRHI